MKVSLQFYKLFEKVKIVSTSMFRLLCDNSTFSMHFKRNLITEYYESIIPIKYLVGSFARKSEYYVENHLF